MNEQNLDQKVSKKSKSAEQAVTELEQINAISTSASSVGMSTTVTDQAGTEHAEIEIRHGWIESLVQFLVDLATTSLVVYMAVEFGVDNLAVTGSITGAGIGGALLLDGWHIYQKSQESSTYTNIARTLKLPELPKTYGQSFLASLGLSNGSKTIFFILSLVAVVLLSTAIAKDWGNSAIVPLAIIGGGCFHLARRWFDSDVAKNIHTRQQQIIRVAAVSINAISEQTEIQKLRTLNQEISLAKDDLESEKAALEGKLQKEEEEKNRLLEANTKLENNFTNLETRARELSQQYKDLKGQKEDVDIKCVALETKLTDVNKQLVQKQLELSKQSNYLQKVLQENEELLKLKNNLLKDVSELKKEKQELQNKTTQLEEAISQLSVSNASATVSSNRI